MKEKGYLFFLGPPSRGLFKEVQLCMGNITRDIA